MGDNPEIINFTLHMKSSGYKIVRQKINLPMNDFPSEAFPHFREFFDQLDSERLGTMSWIMFLDPCKSSTAKITNCRSHNNTIENDSCVDYILVKVDKIQLKLVFKLPTFHLQKDTNIQFLDFLWSCDSHQPSSRLRRL